MAGGIGESARWAWKKFNSTVINDIWPEMWFFTIIALAVCLINKYTDVKFVISNQLLTVLGTVLGLVISFRTTSAYDRFWEGRKLWGNIALHSRTLGMLIWIHVPLDRSKPGQAPKQDQKLRALIERKTMLNLVQAFSVSVKHYLRSEPGIYYEDLYPLLSFLPQNIEGTVYGGGAGDGESSTADADSLPMWTHTPSNTTRKVKKRKDSFDPEKVLPNIRPDGVTLRPARSPPKETIYDVFPPSIILLPFHIIFKKLIGREGQSGGRDFLGKKAEPAPIESNIPLEISLFLSSYLQRLLAQGLLTPAMATGFNNSMVAMQDAVTNLERIRTTPIPFAYQAHLRMSVWLYLLFLPLEIYAAFGWLTIPCCCFAAFLYLGFLEIGQEIENPFNYDENDLDLDHFCLQIQRELAEITAHPAPDPTTFIFSGWNQPFAPTDRRTAEQIIHARAAPPVGTPPQDEETTIQGIRATLLKNYQEINAATHNTSRAKFLGGRKITEI